LGKWIWHLESKYGGWRNLQEQKINAKDSSWWRDLNKVCGRKFSSLNTEVGETCKSKGSMLRIPAGGEI